MNGRALNEKAIEISPSSNRVLDRAAEILQPFPPSKNRPRPGDWTCPSCGFSNFQRRTACFRCSYPGVGGHSGDSMGYGGYGYGAPHMMGPPHHHVGHHGGYGQGHGRGGGGGGMVPFRAGDWKCGSEGCGYHNFAKNISCLRCGASRAGAAVIADSTFNASPMDPPSGFGMGPPSMAGTPGPGPFAAAAGNFHSNAFGGPQYGGHQSNYGMPAPMGPAAGGFPPVGASYGHGGPSQSAGPFDSRAEAAFSSVGNGPASAGGMPPASAGANGSMYGGPSFAPNDGGPNLDSITSGFGLLGVNDSTSRRNPDSTRSPQ